jgi:Leucine-rich repeat (LRR) protein
MLVIEGSFPISFGNLTLLEEVDLSSNDLTGSILDSLGGWTRIRQLDLSRNKFTGSNPTNSPKRATKDCADLIRDQLKCLYYASTPY